MVNYIYGDDNRNTLVSMTSCIINYTGSNAIAISCGADHTYILLNTVKL